MTTRQQRRTLEQTEPVQPSKHCCFLMHAMYISQRRSCFLVKVICVSIVLLFIQYNPQQWILPSADAVSSITYSNREFTPLTHCPGGFYSEEELKPHLQRPPQDPKAPGADGKPFEWAMTPGEKLEESEGFAKHGFNQFASDRISLHRDLGEDTRHPDCLAQKFHHCLPKTSVIIVFHNEAWSTLLRTVYSVLHTAPAALLTEIILVDDGSTDDHLQTPLDDYVKQLKIVRVLRQEWKGIVAARLLGAQSARGEVLTFLDAHCECFPGWLEPLLARIVEQPSAVVTPNIVSIDEDDLEFIKPEAIVRIRGKFDWILDFTWEDIPEEEMRKWKNVIFPIRTPTFIGGIFSVSKSYFESIGTYDNQMKFWGGENLEMSFRVWQCGGQLEIIPCSVVGHIYRKFSPHEYPNSTVVIARNLVRLAEVWMDEYRWVVYRTNAVANSLFRDKSFGNVTDRQQLRERLKCKSFSWYLQNVYPEAYVPDIVPLKFGQIENIGLYCNLDAEITNNFWKPVQKFECSDNNWAKFFEYTSEREIRLSTAAIDLCLHANPGSIAVTIKHCQLKGKGTSVAPEQVWIFTKKNQLINFASGKCLTVMDTFVYQTTCNELDPKQQWNFI